MPLLKRAARGAISRWGLEKLARHHGTDKLSHGYCPAYERHLGPLRDQSIDLLEIGVWTGNSLRMWADYFPRARVVGVDIEDYGVAAGGRIEVVITDIKAYRPDRDFDVVVDDGSHVPEDVFAASSILWPRLRPGGWYVVEDVEATWVAQALIGGPHVEAHLYPQIVFLRKL
jgi:8-demethyl-8-alpha-L-rhamnosyltetracenomycin-C 2'-O-methyltransferase